MYHVSLLKNVYLLLSSILFPAIQSFQIEPRIIGGTVADDNYPFMASILVQGEKGSSHKCGGSIINERTVLTAAHCLTDLIPANLKVHVGDKTLELQEGEVHEVKTIYVHEKFNSTTCDYDVGLIRTMNDFTFGANIEPIILAAPGNYVEEDSYATIMGWGITNNGTLADQLMMANVPVIEQATCNRLLNDKITERMLCAGFYNGTVDACNFDSGSPLVFNNLQIGIVSWGHDCALPNTPGVYARVSELFFWIQDTLFDNYREILF